MKKVPRQSADALDQIGPKSIEWQYQPEPDPHLVFYPNRLRKCTR